jgi:hypothetical protein
MRVRGAPGMVLQPIQAPDKASAARGASQQRCPKRGSAREPRPMNVNDHEDFTWQAFVTPIEPEPTREAWLYAAIERLAHSVFPPFKPPRWRTR